MRPREPGVRHSAPRLLGRPLVVLTACLVIAGAGLAWFTVRTVIQERTIAAQQIRDGATAAASRVAEGIVPELERLGRGLRLVVKEDGDARDATAIASGTNLSDSSGDDSVLLLIGRDGTVSWPRGRLLYEPEPSATLADEAGWPATKYSIEHLGCSNQPGYGPGAERGSCHRGSRKNRRQSYGTQMV